MNIGLKMKFEKEKGKKGKTSAGFLSAQPGLPAHLASPQRPANHSFFFLFPLSH
jgi:hypothetical protein